MLFFGLSLAAGVAAVFAAQKMDIECLNPPAPKRIRRQQKTASGETSAAFIPGAAFLRQQ